MIAGANVAGDVAVRDPHCGGTQVHKGAVKLHIVWGTDDQT